MVIWCRVPLASLGNCTEACYDDYVYENRTYNLAGYPESITHKRNTRTLSSFDYVYSVDGNMVEKHDDEGRSTYYTYDDMNRLIEEVEELDGDVVQTYEYEFDDFSNRTELYAYGDEDYTVTYWYDANNRLLESEKDDGYTETVTEYSYDDNGNQVEKGVWIDNSFDSSETREYNGFNQLVSVSNEYADTTYTYAPSGLRLTKTVDGDQIYFVYDGDNVVAELYDDEVTAYYLRGLNLYGAFIGNDEYFYLYNAHGDVVNLTDTSGYIEHTYSYDAFGTEREPASSDNNPFRYCGEYYDGETGSYYLRARYYDTVVGRFMQEDPHWTNINRVYEDTLNQSTYLLQPQITAIMQSGNLYTYSTNNPLLYVDRQGRFFELAYAGGGSVAAFSAINGWNLLGWGAAVIVVGAIIIEAAIDSTSANINKHLPAVSTPASPPPPDDDNDTWVSNSTMNHIQKRHNPNKVAKQTPYSTNKYDFENRSYYNANWSESDINDAVKYGYKQAQTQGVTNGAYDYYYKGEQVRIELHNGQVKTGYGFHSYTFEEISSLLK